MDEQHGDRMPAAVVSGLLSLRHPFSLSMTCLCRWKSPLYYSVYCLCQLALLLRIFRPKFIDRRLLLNLLTRVAKRNTTLT